MNSNYSFVRWVSFIAFILTSGFCAVTQAAWPKQAYAAPGGLLGEYFNGRDFDQLVFGRIDPMVRFVWEHGGPGGGVNDDNFSVRWTGQICPTYSERYTFSVGADSVRLWVNGQLLIDEWHEGGPGFYQGEIDLIGAQPVDIRIEYVETSDAAGIQFCWESRSLRKEFLAMDSLRPPCGLWTAYYGPNDFGSGIAPRTSRLENWVDLKGDKLPAVAQSGYFTTTWTGWLTAPITGEYCFLLKADAAARLSLDGEILLDETGGGEFRVCRWMNGGQPVELNVTYQAAANASRVQLFWESQDIPLELIPCEAFLPLPPKGPNRAPYIQSPGYQVLTCGVPWEMEIGAWDPDGDDINLIVENLPPGLTYNSASRRIYGRPTLSGTFKVGLIISDGLLRDRYVDDWTVIDALKGLVAEYFNGTNFNEPVTTRIDPAVDFYWPGSPAEGVNPDFFSVRWSGILVPDRSEMTQFYIRARETARLYINDELVVDTGDFGEGYGAISLTEWQPVNLRLEYVHGVGSARVELRWNSDTRPWGPVPCTRLFTGDCGAVESAKYLPSMDEPGQLGAGAKAGLEFAASTAACPQILLNDDGSYDFSYRRLGALDDVLRYRLQKTSDFINWTDFEWVPESYSYPYEGVEEVRFMGHWMPEANHPECYFRVITTLK